MTMKKRVFITDCEGPITKNDNAAELAEKFIPDGSKFFSTVSLYDDYLAEVIRKPGYKAGDTLKLILPFFKAFGLTDEAMRSYSRDNILIVPGADDVLRATIRMAPAYIVSTSYSAYIDAVCDAIGFPRDHAYSTALHIDDYTLESTEETEVRALHRTIVELPDFTIPDGAERREDLGVGGLATIDELDRIFWQELPKLKLYRIVEEINPIGGSEKARAVREIADREGTDIDSVIYVGDSITDVEAFRLVRNAGGCSISFNGNGWAVRAAEFAITAHSAAPIGLVAELFLHRGKEALADLTFNPVVDSNKEELSTLSTRVRKEVRSEKIGSLG